MAISPHGYPTQDPANDEPTEGPLYCETCETEREHYRNSYGNWECEYVDLHAAAQASLEDYVRESILEAFRKRLGAGHIGQREREIAAEVAGMAPQHSADVTEAES